MGLSRGSSKIISVTPAAASFATPYSSGDVIGAVNTIAAAVLDTKGTALLHSITVLDKSNSKVALDLVFFNDTPANSIGADNAAYGLNDADLDKVLGRVSIATTDYVSSGSNNAEATLKGVALLLQALATSKNVYMAVIARGAITLGSATDLIVKLGLIQD